jgi:HSP20 family protein
MVTANYPTLLSGLTPADPLRELQHGLNRLFGSGFDSFFPEREENWSLMYWAPACDIYENENEIVVKAELPEVNKEDVHVEVENKVLTIRGERRFEDEAKRENYHRVERSYGGFMRSFPLPATVDMDKISAGFKDEVLRLVLPKRTGAKPKQIEVKVR